MNKKAEKLLERRNIVARQILGDKKFYENRIAKEKKEEEKEINDFNRGLNSGMEIGLNVAAYNCKRLLELMLLGEVM